MNALHVINWALASDLTTAERLVLVAIAARASGCAGHYEEAISTLQEKTALSERWVRTILRNLTGRGILTAEFRTRQTTVYRVVEGALVARHKGALKGALKGAQRVALTAPDQIDQIDQKDQTDVEGPETTPPYRVEGAATPPAGEVEPHQVAELLQLQRVEGEELMPLPRLGDRSSRTVERALRDGWSVEQLEELMSLALEKGIRIATWPVLMKPSFGPLQDEARNAVADRAVRRQREERTTDPWAQFRGGDVPEVVPWVPTQKAAK